MPRPSQHLDRALLASGRALFPDAGCAGLTVRALAEHSGVSPAMFHYHFASKDDFLRTLLQQLYEEMFTTLAGQAGGDGPAPERLRAALRALARFARAHRRELARLWMDALAGEPVAVEFFARNAPRHLGVLLGLLGAAEEEGSLRELPPLQRLMHLLGAVLLPMVFVAGLVQSRAVPALPGAAFEAEVMSDAAIDQRIELALAALLGPAARTGARP